MRDTVETRRVSGVGRGATGAEPKVAVLQLAEGNAETWDSWSGSSHSLLLALRSLGCDVRAIDVSSYGPSNWLSMARTISWRRSRWAARHHFGPVGFRFRSARATGAAESRSSEALLQIGATFEVSDASNRPLFCFCDANVLFAARGRPYSDIAPLTDRELRSVIERERRIYARATTIFTMSDCLRQSFVDDFGIDPKRVVTVRAGANLRRIPSEADLGAPKAAEPTVLFVGKQFERKGGPQLVTAFQRVRQALPHARLLIVGSRPEIPPVPGIEVIGYVDREASGARSLAALYLTSDLFCMPSRYEPFGAVFVEAMLHGLPCVATDQWAMPEIIDDGATGWLAPADDIGALTQALIKALSNRQQLRRMGEEARRRALDKFSWTRVASMMIEAMARS
jgi:glycosyltransferase involved in cell wall biosynthesis